MMNICSKIQAKTPSRFTSEMSFLKTKAMEFVVSLFPTWTSATEEITHAADWVYTHNPFGSERMKFKSHK